MLQYEDYKRASGKQRHEPHDLDNTQNQKNQQTRVPCVSQEMLHRILQYTCITYTHTDTIMCMCVSINKYFIQTRLAYTKIIKDLVGMTNNTAPSAH